MPGTERLRSALSDRYVIEKELGAGGMATVYLAHDIKHDREVALKVLRSDLSAVVGTERFLSEVRITARLDHPHILTLIDSGEADGTLYYVLPYVRGESLRAKLEKERQLSVDEAISITKQIASALDYAHAKGIIHRDIKPENILLHQGEAVLADFGIALAVKEAGGARLTQTGLSLGTPLYMSPEQALGDRSLDKRSDVYSLGAVFYEMIAGEPPITGASPQAIVAKLLTERPVKLRVVRQGISRTIEAATEKALMKTPADRFPAAGSFVSALESQAEPFRQIPGKLRIRWISGMAAAAAISLAWWAAGHKPADSSTRVTALPNRTQITNSGEVQFPRISPDGRSFAYVANDCTSNGCRHALHTQDIGGAGRRLLTGIAGVQGLDVSPDRRHILFTGTYGGVFGAHLVSVIDGTPRHVVVGSGSFSADGDSLLLVRMTNRFQSSWILVAQMDGTVSDSIQIAGPADDILVIAPVPGTRKILYSLLDGETTRWYSIDRSGKRYATLEIESGVSAPGIASEDALWLTLSKNGSDNVSLVRIPFDTVSGKFGLTRDTVYSGLASAISVTADGKHVLFDERTVQYSNWAMSFDDMLKGSFPDEKRLAQATVPLWASISPDGKRVMFSRNTPTGRALQLMSYPSGPETTVRELGGGGAWLADSVTSAVVRTKAGSTEFVFADLRTSSDRIVAATPESGLSLYTNMATHSWGWLRQDGNAIRVQSIRENKPREFNRPAWLLDVRGMRGSPNGERLALFGLRATAMDSIGLGVLDLRTGRFDPVWSLTSALDVQWLDNETMLIHMMDAPESWTYYRLKLGGKAERLGSTRRPTWATGVSSDLKRAVVMTRDNRGDAWTMKVAK